MTGLERLYSLLCIALGIAGLGVAVYMCANLRDEYHFGSSDWYEALALGLVLFGLPSFITLVIAIINLASGHLQNVLTRLQTYALIFTCVGIPLGIFGSVLHKRRYPGAFDDPHHALQPGDEESYHRPRDEE